MSQPERPSRPTTPRGAANLALAGLTGQVGCLTVLIVGAALVVGLWLDNRLDTRPLFTLVLLLASVPVTLVVMFRVALSTARRIQTRPPPRSQDAENTHSDDF